MKPKRRPEASLEVDPEIYPLEAVEAAAYAFTDRAFAAIARAGKSLRVTLRPKNGTAPETLEGEFGNELLHQTLRARVSRENAKLREYIVTRALVSAQPVEAECADCAAPPPPAQAPPVDAQLEKEIETLLAAIEKQEGAEDPLGVIVPWEDKFGEAKAAPAPAPEAPKPPAPAPPPAAAPVEDAKRARARLKAERLVSEDGAA